MTYRKRAGVYKRRAIGKGTCPPTVNQLAVDVRRLNKKVKNLPRPELELYEQVLSAPASIAYNLNVANYPLFQPAIGLGDQDRKGDLCTMKKLHLRLEITSGATAVVPQEIRVLLLQARNRFVPDITASTTNPQCVWEQGGSVDAINSFLSWDNRGHFMVLRDFRTKVTPDSLGTGTSIKFLKVNYTFKKHNKTIKFESGGTVDAEHNQVYLLLLSDISSGGGTTVPTVVYTSRITFYDN